MSGIWIQSTDGWRLGSPQGFPDERTLHSLIQENPQLLPLAGSPRLTVIGSEVQLGTGYADILAVEQYGRPVVIEIKLARNAEARRAIVAQVLAYAAFLRGMASQGLEQIPSVKSELAGRGSILEAVQGDDQEGVVEPDDFAAALQDYLHQGHFRLVLVLDEVSAELERLVAYLDAITLQALTIDLIKVEVYEVNGAQVALPQRVAPDLSAAAPTAPTRRGAASHGVLTDGSAAFRESVKDAAGEAREAFDRLIEWAEEVAALPKMRLATYAGAGGRFTLLPRIMPDNAGLVTIWNDGGEPYISVWRSVFERRAPNSIDAVERAIEPLNLGQGNNVWALNDEHLDGLLTALRAAYEEATGG